MKVAWTDMRKKICDGKATWYKWLGRPWAGHVPIGTVLLLKNVTITFVSCRDSEAIL